jgi:hypothetical protein
MNVVMLEDGVGSLRVAKQGSLGILAIFCLKMGLPMER